MEPQRILQVVTIMNRGGLENMLMNYYRQTDKTQIQFDFMVHRLERGSFDDEIESMGGRIYRMPPIHPRNFSHYFKKLDQFFKDHKEYKIVHAHLDLLSSFVLKYAKKNHVPVRISHSHIPGIPDKGFKKLFKLYSKSILNAQCTHRFACGEEAARFQFTNQAKTAIILKNAVDTSLFKFNPTSREDVRKSLNIQDQFLIGHVGRFDHIKNQSFALDVLKEITLTDPDAKMIFLGDGELKDQIIQKSQTLGLTQNAIFKGVVSNVNDYLSAMDLFLIPSVYEGGPLVAIEAQASGLPILASTGISPEANVTGLIEYLPLSHSPKIWAQRAISYKNAPRATDTIDTLIKTGYDIQKSATELQEFYLNALQHGTKIQNKG